jgi:hypothetical protein
MQKFLLDMAQADDRCHTQPGATRAPTVAATAGRALATAAE